MNWIIPIILISFKKKTSRLRRKEETSLYKTILCCFLKGLHPQWDGCSPFLVFSSISSTSAAHRLGLSFLPQTNTPRPHLWHLSSSSVGRQWGWSCGRRWMLPLPLCHRGWEIAPVGRRGVRRACLQYEWILCPLCAHKVLYLSGIHCNSAVKNGGGFSKFTISTFKIHKNSYKIHKIFRSELWDVAYLENLE